MIQAVVEPEMRGDLGMHYTSVPNIMKVLHPLFLMELEQELEDAFCHREEKARLKKLLDRIANIRVFDPACGSGNFLIIAYRELRKIEMRIYQREDELNKGQTQRRFESVVKLESFYGIEYADFATETAKLSLWIVEYQMNSQFKVAFGNAPPALPLNTGGNIHHGNALRLDWNAVCPLQNEKETFLCGNPPYLGRKQQTKAHKDDMAEVFLNITKKYKKLDYVSCWLIKGVQYCHDKTASCAFVMTNSIFQGEHVPILWPHIYEYEVEIGFAYKSFKWRNNAAKNAGVTCVVAGLRRKSGKPKYLYEKEHYRQVTNINPYLIEFDDIIVKAISNAKTSKPIMRFGNMAADGGNLILSRAEKGRFLDNSPQASKFVKRLCGSQEFIKGINRSCLWIKEADLAEAIRYSFIKDRVEATKLMREHSKDAGTRGLATRPHQFREMHCAKKHTIIAPRVASEKREYLTLGILPPEDIISDSALALYDGPIWLLSVLSSKLHIVWVKSVCGQLETRIRYSNTLGYNTFPVPELSIAQEEALESHAWNIIAARDEHPGKTIAWLYNPETMPANVLEAHQALDDTLEKIYIGRPFKNDTERLEHLFKLYAKMIAQQGGSS
jgi:MmeI, DNA-methyltransferase domain/MmeI, target recognition domain/MmeI, C-terminal domain